VPRVRVVTVKTTELTTCGPRHEAHAWTINRRAGGERMQETDVTRLEGFLDDRLGDVLTQPLTKLKRVRCFERGIFRRLQLIHRFARKLSSLCNLCVLCASVVIFV